MIQSNQVDLSALVTCYDAHVFIAVARALEIHVLALQTHGSELRVCMCMCVCYMTDGAKQRTGFCNLVSLYCVRAT